MTNVIKFLLLEDDQRDRFQIRGAIKDCYNKFSNLSKGRTIEIIDFDFSGCVSSNDVKRQLLSEIDNHEYASVVIDQKIVLQNCYVDGNELFEYAKNSIPSFPVVMLTQVPEECKENGIVDYDKIYEKKEFLKNDSDLVKRLIRNAEQYLNNLNNIFVELAKFNDETIDDFQRYIELETKLSNYLPKFYTKNITQSFSEEYKKILSLIEQLERHINEK